MFSEATKKAAAARFKQPATDAEGQEIEVDIREDEEQNVKLRECIELLLAAGYFRARIKGLSSFDKIIGGLTWCIQASNFDVDVDLLFQENSTIGQKIALTEKIVAVLPRMKCPHRIEPHQIQGLDFIHIYPVIQWLVKLAIATKEEMGDYIRAYSESQFNKKHTTPEDAEFESRKQSAIASIGSVKETYKAQRRYRRPQDVLYSDEETQVHTTLLEYGRRYGLSRALKSEKEEKKLPGVGGEAKEVDLRADEEKRIKALMKGLQAAEANEMLVSTSAVGSIVGLQSAEIQQMAMEYEGKRADLEAGKKPDKAAGAQAHQRTVASLQKQIGMQEKKCQEAQVKHDELHALYSAAQQKLEEVESYGRKIAEEMEKLNQLETDENKGVLQQLRALVALNQNLKKQEQQFKAYCKDEKTRLEEAIARLEAEGGEGSAEEKEHIAALKEHYLADQQRLQKIKALLARKNRETALLQRKIDEVPSRAELAQYQRRFIELYDQVSSTLTETRQFYDLYNSLEDQKTSMEKEASIITSIHEKFELGMSSEKNKESFLKQVEEILQGIKQDRERLERRCQDEKSQRDKLNTAYLDLVEKQRTYYKTVKDFQEECSKNEALLAKVKAKAG